MSCTAAAGEKGGKRRREALARAGNRLRQLAEELQGAARRVTDKETVAAFDAAASAITATVSEIAAPDQRADLTAAVQPVEQAITRLETVLATLTRLTGGTTASAAPPSAPGGNTSLLTAIDALNDTVERIARQAVALERAELAIQEQSSHLGAVEQIGEVVVEEVELRVLALELRVHRG